MKMNPGNQTIQIDGLKAIDNFIMAGGEQARITVIKHGAIPLVLNALRTHPTAIAVQIEGFRTFSNLICGNILPSASNGNANVNNVNNVPTGAANATLAASVTGTNNASNAVTNDLSTAVLNGSGNNALLFGNLNSLLVEYGIPKLILSNLEIETFELILNVCRTIYILIDVVGQPFVNTMIELSAGGNNFFHRIFIVMQQYIQDPYIQQYCLLIYYHSLLKKVDINVLPFSSGSMANVLGNSGGGNTNGFIHDIFAFTVRSIGIFKDYPAFIAAGLRFVDAALGSYFPDTITVNEVITQNNLIVTMFAALNESVINTKNVRVGDKESMEDAGMTLLQTLMSATFPVSETSITPLKAIIDNGVVSMMFALAKSGNIGALKSLFSNYSNVFITVLNANDKLLEEHMLANPGESTDYVMRASFTAMHNNVDSPQVVCAALDLINALFAAAQSPHLRIQLLTYVLFNSELGFLSHTIMKAHFSSSSTMFKLLQAIYNVFSATDIPPISLCEASVQERVISAVAAVMKEYPSSLGLQTKAMCTIQRILDAAIMNGETIEIPLEKETYQVMSASLDNFVNNPDIYGNYIAVLAKFSRLGSSNRMLIHKDNFVKTIINAIKVFPDNVFIASCCCEALVALSKDVMFYADAGHQSARPDHGGLSSSGAAGSLATSGGAPSDSSIVDIVITIIRINKSNPVILAPAFSSLYLISSNSKDLLEAVVREDIIPIAVSLLKAFRDNTGLIKSVISFINVIAKSKKDIAKSLCSDMDLISSLLSAVTECPVGSIAISVCEILGVLCAEKGTTSWGEGPAITICNIINTAADAATPDVMSMRAGFNALSSLVSTDNDGATAKALSEFNRIEKLISVISKNAAAVSLVDAAFATLAEIAIASKENRETIGKCNAIHVIVTSMVDKGNRGNVSANGCYALGALASSDDGPSPNRDIIGSESGISAIFTSMIDYANDELVQKYGCMALGNIGFRHAENAKVITRMGGTTAIFVAMQNNPTNYAIQTEACRALGKIVDGNCEAAEAIGDDGLNAVVRTLRTSAGSMELQEASLYALHSFLNASDSMCARVTGAGSDILEVVASVGKASTQNAEIQERVCSILALVSKCNEERQRLIQLQQKQQQELEQQSQEHISQQPQARVLQRQNSMNQMPVNMGSVDGLVMVNNPMNNSGIEMTSLDFLMETVKKGTDNPLVLQSTFKRMHGTLKQMKVQNNPTVQDVFVAKGGIKLIIQIIIVSNNHVHVRSMAFAVLSVLCDNDATASEIVTVLVGTNMVAQLLCDNMNPAIVRDPILHRSVSIIVGSLSRFRQWVEVLEAIELIPLSIVRILTSYINVFPVVKTCLQVMSKLSSVSSKLASGVVKTGSIRAALSVLSSLAPINPSADQVSTNIEECVVIFLGNICVKEQAAIQAFVEAGGVTSVIALVQKYYSAYTEPTLLGLIKSLLYLIAVLGSKTNEDIRIEFYESGVVMPLILGTFNAAIAGTHPENMIQPLLKSASIAFANMIISRKVLDSINAAEVPSALISLLEKQTNAQVISELVRAISKMAVSREFADALYSCNAIAVLTDVVKKNLSVPNIMQYAALAAGSIIDNCSKEGFDYDDSSDDEDDDSDDDDDDSDDDSDDDNIDDGSKNENDNDEKSSAVVEIQPDSVSIPAILGEEFINTLISTFKSSKNPMLVDNILLALSRAFLYNKKDREIIERIDNFTKIVFDKVVLYPRNEALKRSCFESLEYFCTVKSNERFRTEFLTLGGVKFLIGQITAFQSNPSVCEACLKLLDTLTGRRHGELGEHSKEDVAARFLYNERGLPVLTTLIKVYSQQRNIQIHCCSLLEKIETVAGENLPPSAQDNLLELIFLAMKTHYLYPSVQYVGNLFIARIAGYGSLCTQIVRRGALTILIDTLQRHKAKNVQVSGIKALAAIAAASRRDPACSALMISHIDTAVKVVINAMRMCPQQAAIQEVACLFIGNIVASNERNAATLLADGGLPVLTTVLENFASKRPKPVVLKNACYALASLTKSVPNALSAAVKSATSASGGQNTTGRLIINAMNACPGFEALQRYAIVALGAVIPGTPDTSTEQDAVHSIIRSLSVLGKLAPSLFCETCITLSILVDGSRSNGTLFVRSGGLDLILPRLVDPSPAIVLSAVRLLTPLYSLASAGLLDPSDVQVSQSFPTLMAILAGAPNGPIKRKVFKCITKCFAAAPLVPELMVDLACHVLPACPNPSDLATMEFWKVDIIALVFLTSENSQNCNAIVTSEETVKAVCGTVAALFAPPPDGFAPPPADVLEYLAILVGNICKFGYASIKNNLSVLNEFNSLKGLIVEVHKRMKLNDDIMKYALDKIVKLAN